MAEKKIVAEPRKQVGEIKKVEVSSNLFGRENYIWLLAGIAVIALGLILMAG